MKLIAQLNVRRLVHLQVIFTLFLIPWYTLGLVMVQSWEREGA